MARILTVGHGTRTTAQLRSVLASGGCELVIDVRRFPGSRRHPHLAREPLSRGLAETGIGYEWWGEDLGGRRRPTEGSRNHGWRNAAFRGYADHMSTPGFRSALQRLVSRAETTELAVMCSETLWWRCHRRLIADALVLGGHEVVHLIDEKNHQPHPLRPEARVDEDGTVVYDLGSTGTLPI